MPQGTTAKKMLDTPFIRKSNTPIPSHVTTAISFTSPAYMYADRLYTNDMPRIGSSQYRRFGAPMSQVPVKPLTVTQVRRSLLKRETGILMLRQEPLAAQIISKAEPCWHQHRIAQRTRA